MANPVAGITSSIDAEITSGSSITASVPLYGHILCGIYMPAGWTAADMTFQASNDGLTWYDIQFAGAEFSQTVAASQYIAIDPTPFYGVRYVKLRSGTSGAAVNQGADRSLVLMVGRPDG